MISRIAIDYALIHVIHALKHALSNIKPRLLHGAGLAIMSPRLIGYAYKFKPKEFAKIFETNSTPS